MGNIFISKYINTTLLLTILSSFTLTYSVPVSAFQPTNMVLNVNDIAFMIRLEKVVEKLIKSEKKGTDKIISCLVEVKQEIEFSYNIKLNTDKYLDEVYKELKKKGNKPKKKHFDIIKKKIKCQDKKHKHHARFLADVMYVEGYEMNPHDEAIMTEAYELEDLNHAIMKTDKEGKHDKKDDKEEVFVPSQVIFGVTMSLCGLFLMSLPIPVCKEWGIRIFMLGISACSSPLCLENDKHRKKDKEKDDGED